LDHDKGDNFVVDPSKRGSPLKVHDDVAIQDGLDAAAVRVNYAQPQPVAMRRDCGNALPIRRPIWRCNSRSVRSSDDVRASGFGINDV